MNGSVTINGVKYKVDIDDLTPADVLPVFRTDTSIVKTDSILLHSAGPEQNSAKKVLLPHLVSVMSASVADDVVLTIEPYYNESGEYQGMYWHYNSGWLIRTDTGEMIRVDDTAAEIAMAGDIASRAAIDANKAASGATAADNRATANENKRVTDEKARKTAETERQQSEQERRQNEQEREEQSAYDHSRAEQDHTRSASDHSTAVTDHTRAEGDHSTAVTDHTRADGDHTTAVQDHATAASDHTRAEQDHTTASQDHSRADQDHTASVEATAAATKVNADLTGMTVTITDRNGQSRSVNIGFEILEDHVYPSLAAMNADAANVRAGEFCMIATTDPTSPDNAQLWSRNSSAATSEHPFTFLSDLDQASSAAWADWLDNMKPQIEADHTRAQNDHDTASSDHATALQDHSTASADHSTATQDHATATQDHTTASDDHIVAGTDHDTAESDHATAGDDHSRAEQDHTVYASDHSRAETDHATATQDHNTASQDHSRAEQDHTRSESDHGRAEQDHTTSVTATANANTQANRAKEWADNEPYIADGTEEHPGDLNFWYIWNEASGRYVKSPYAKGDDLHWDEMSEQEKEDLSEKVLERLTFATDDTCESIIDELT